MRAENSHEDDRRIRPDSSKTAALVATLGPFHEEPWWWRHVDSVRAQCNVDYERLTFRGKYSQDISTLELPAVMFKILRRLIQWRRSYDYVFSIECDLVGFSVAFWQTITRMKRPRHVIVQFIMREKENTIRSRLKYLLMRFMFSSVHRVVVSSTNELEYYRGVFGWPRKRLVFVPVLTNPEWLKRECKEEGDYYLAAGRTFRDFDTLLEAANGANTKLIIVGGGGTVDKYSGQANVQVMQNIPVSELEELVLGARAVVVPLQDRQISIGQSVLLQAMALGKPVIATRVAGTTDYIEHMVDGVLVGPGDASDLRHAMEMLGCESVRRKLGRNARLRVLGQLLPEHYAAGIRSSLCD